MTAPADAPLVDAAVFGELQQAAGAGFVAELLDTFCDDMPVMLAALRASAAAADVDGWRRAAHSIKSNALTFGAQALAARARALELGGRGADADAAVNALQRQWQATSTALRALQRLRDQQRPGHA